MHCGFPEWSVPKDSARCVQGCKHENLTAQGHSPFRVRPGLPPMTSSFLLSLLSSSKRLPNSTRMAYQLPLHCQPFCSYCAILGFNLPFQCVKQIYTYLNFHRRVNSIKYKILRVQFLCMYTPT